MEDFVCNNCGYRGTPDGTSTCPDCLRPTMTPVAELGGEAAPDAVDALPAEPESLEDLAEDELDDTKDGDEDDEDEL